MAYAQYNTEVVADAPLIRHTFETDYSNSGSLTVTTAHNSPTRTAANAGAGSAAGIKVDGSSFGYVQDTSTDPYFNDKNFAVEAWIKTTTAGGDYKTIVRRSTSTSHFLLRVRGNAIADAGKVDVYYGVPGGGTVNFYSTNRVDDGLWHHIVVSATGAGQPMILYVDGVSAGSQTIPASGTHANTNPLQIGREQTGTEYFDGSIDEVAIYGSFLTATRVTAHYNAALAAGGTNGGFTALPATASALMADPVVGLGGGYTAQAMTASATAPGGTGKGNTVIGTIIGDVTPSLDLKDYVAGSDTTAAVSWFDKSNGAEYGTLHIKTSQPVLAPGEALASANLKLTASAARAADVFEIWRVTSDWNESTLTYNTRPTKVSVGYVNIPALSAGQSVTINVAAVFDATNYGLALTRRDNSANSALVFYTKETTNAANRPTITFNTAVISSASITTTPMAASALAIDPTVSTGSDVSASGQPMAANASLVDPMVSLVRNPEVVATPLTASADMPAGTGYSVASGYAAEVMLVDASSVDATVATTSNVNYAVQVISGTISLRQPSAVNGQPIIIQESEDPYFQRVYSLTPEVWWRLNDKTSTVDDRMNAFDGVYNGVLFGQFDGPNGRHSVKFDGISDYIAQTEPGYDEGSNESQTIEITFRTTKKNAVILWQRDSTSPSISLNTQQPVREMFLRDGKIVLRSHYYGNSLGSPDGFVEMQGFKNVADGEWHHVVISPAIETSQGVDAPIGTEIHIDGKLDIRRYTMKGFYGFPDYVGGLPGGSANFEGDMAEIVMYKGDLSHDNIIKNYYAVMGWVPIEVDSMTASATSVDAKARGNQKRALYLYWNKGDEETKDSGSWEFGSDDYSFDPVPGLVSQGDALRPTPDTPVGDYHGYKVFAKPIMTNNGANYRDPVTDEPSLIDLEHHVDLDDYDVIMFKDWPDESGNRYDNWGNIYSVMTPGELDFVESVFPGQKERLLQQIRDANDRGIGLFITNPRLAVDLGIIDRVEWIPTLHESKAVLGQGNASGHYDYGSAAKFPWDIDSNDGLMAGQFARGIGEPMTTDPNYLASKAYFYSDTNDNNKFRVRALVDGLTNLPSYMIEDAVWHTDFDLYGWQGLAYKYLHRIDGLQLGDEFIFDGAEIIDHGFQQQVEYARARYFGTFATPINNVKAGTVVTTFGATHWQGTEVVDNPYKDYATTIVLEPGDMLAGKRVGGKIFVNFTEQPGYGEAVPVQVLPGSEYDAGVADDAINLEVPIFDIIGTPEQVALAEDAISRTNFPFNAIQKMYQARYGGGTVPIVFADIDPGGEPGVMGTFNPNTGVLTVDEQQAKDFAPYVGVDWQDRVRATVIHEIAHMIDEVYLQPYQRVNIWNVFHGDWNVYHKSPFSGANVYASDYLLPEDFDLQKRTTNIHLGESWLGGGSYRTERVGEAFAHAFVVAYSDIPVMTNQFDPHRVPEFIGPMIRAAIETGPNAFIFDSQMDTDWPLGYQPETEAQREWEFSWTRTSLTHTAGNTAHKVVTVELPGGGEKKLIQIEGGDANLANMSRSRQLFPIIYVPKFHMGARGMYWLAAEVAPGTEGDVRTKATPMTATVTMPEPDVTAERDNNVTAKPMVAIAYSIDVLESDSKDAGMPVFPMVATALMQGPGTVISATPMTATAALVENFDMVHASGEQVVLTLHGYDATLFIKEEA